MVIEYLEFVCQDKENERRKREGRISKEYSCHQLTGIKTSYRDQKDQPIRVQIRNLEIYGHHSMRIGLGRRSCTEWRRTLGTLGIFLM